MVARLVPDNLKTGADKPDLYDPKINRSYGEMAAHYDTLIDPARAFKPRDKPRVERPMPYVRDSFWRGREFTSIEAVQADAVRWCVEVAGQRRCRALDGAAPARVFAAVEAPALRALPARQFVLATWSTGKVGPDIHVRAGKTLYSLPWRLIGHQVQIRSTTTTVQIVHDQDVVATHVRKQSGKVTNFDHYPPERIAFHMRTPVWCRRTAEDVGPACVQLVGDLLALNALYRLRSAQGVLGLREKHTPARLEAACAKAIRVGDPSYRTVKGILVAGTETENEAETGGGVAAQGGAFLRGPDQLFAHPGHRTSSSRRRGRAGAGMSATAGPAPTGEQVAWVMSIEVAKDLVMLLGTLEDFLREASLEVVAELADYPRARPVDPSRWVDWVADRLGDAALDSHTLATAGTTTGEPR